MKDKLLKIAEMPLTMIDKVLEGVTVQLGEPKKIIGLALLALVAYDLYKGGDAGMIEYGIAKIKEIIGIASGELSKNGTIIGVLAFFYLMFKK